MDFLTRWQGPFILGVIFSLFLPRIPPLFLLLCTFSLSLWLIYYRHLTTSGFLFGFSCFFLHGHLATSWQLPEHLIKQPITIVGKVTDIATFRGEYHRFVLTLDNIAGVKLPRWQSVKVRLTWKDSNQQYPSPKQGQVLQLTAKLKPPHGFANQGGFSYSKWLLLKGIRATGYVYHKLPVRVVNSDYSLRQKIYHKLKTATDDFAFQGVLLALTMGEKQHISDSHWQSIRATGIGHLLAISGLHIGMMFVFCRFIALWVCNSLNLLLHFISRNSINSPVVAMVFGLVGAMLYSWLAGFAVTTVRAIIMLTVAMLLVYFRRGLNRITVLLSALTVILLLDPLAILSPSLWLSFIAVASILLLLWLWPGNYHASGIKPYVGGLVKIQLFLSLTLLPLTALIFNGVSLSGSWVNLIAVPWVSTTTVPLALLATALLSFTFVAEFLFAIADKSLHWLFVFIEQPWNLSGWFNIGFMPWYTWLALLLPLLLFTFALDTKHKIIAGIIWFLPFSNQLSGSKHNWQVDVLDVGQGLAVAVKAKGQLLLYDLGPVYLSGFNTVEQVVLPYLAYHGYKQVDWLVISHSDSDHAGDYQRMLSNIKVNNIIAPDDLALDSKTCTPSTINWQGLVIEIIWPPVNYVTTNRNDASCVLHISNKLGSVLFTGDISKRIEKRLLDSHSEGMNADVIIAPHHGSMSSSSEAFIAQVQPDYVAFSSGFLNRYRFPRPEIVTRYKNNAVIDHTTAISGQISYIFSTQGVEVKTARHHYLPYWYLN